MSMVPQYWWSRNPDEIFWLEISSREDFGTNLTHDIESSSGSLLPSYRLARDEMNIGDVVYHFDQAWDGIRSWSRVSGPFQEADDWWEVELAGPHRLQGAVTYQRIVEAGPRIEQVLRSLPRSREESQYLPFVFSANGLRLAQTYLAKLPRQVLTVFPQLGEALPAEEVGNDN